jgi:hypothetical protein
MTAPDDDFDPDDNFAAAHHAMAEDEGDVTPESLVWQLLLLINPDDEEAALQQFHTWQDAQAAFDPDDPDAPVLDALRDAIDWRAGFTVEAGDAGAFVECITELVGRWNLRVDWGVEDPTDAAFLRDADVSTLIAHAHDKLREHGYTLWTWGVAGHPREEIFSGFITQRHEAEALEFIAPMLGIELRPGSAF